MLHGLWANATAARLCGTFDAAAAATRSARCSSELRTQNLLSAVPDAWPTVLASNLAAPALARFEVPCGTVFRGTTLLLWRDGANIFHTILRDAYYLYLSLLERRTDGAAFDAPLREADLADNVLYVDPPMQDEYAAMYLRMLVRRGGVVTSTASVTSPLCFEHVIARAVRPGFAVDTVTPRAAGSVRGEAAGARTESARTCGGARGSH
jgi:hypothetical protein